MSALKGLLKRLGVCKPAGRHCVTVPLPDADEPSGLPFADDDWINELQEQNRRRR